MDVTCKRMVLFSIGIKHINNKLRTVKELGKFFSVCALSDERLFAPDMESFPF